MQSCKKRVKQWKHWGLGLVVGACFTGTTLATTAPDSSATDSGTPSALGLYCAGSTANFTVATNTNNILVTSDSSIVSVSNLPIVAALPDNNPSGATYPARFYSFAKSSSSPSVLPTVTCSPAIVVVGTYSTSVQLSDGGSCAITITPQANGDPYAGVKYTGTLTRTGNIYRLTNGTVCGSPYSDCPLPPPPINASIDLNFSKQVETFATEIEIK
jgi:hypothetical protein